MKSPWHVFSSPNISTIKKKSKQGWTTPPIQRLKHTSSKISSNPNWWFWPSDFASPYHHYPCHHLVQCFLFKMHIVKQNKKQQQQHLWSRNFFIQKATKKNLFIKAWDSRTHQNKKRPDRPSPPPPPYKTPFLQLCTLWWFSFFNKNKETTKKEIPFFSFVYS